MTDKPDLHLSAIRAIVADAEAEILRIVERVRSSTGLDVMEINLDTLTQWKIEAKRLVTVPARVHLQMEEI